MDNKEVSWRPKSTISTSLDKTVTKDDNDIILNERCDILQEKATSDITKQSETDVIEKGPAVQTRAQKLKEGKLFQKLKVMKGLEVHKHDFKEEQDKD